MQSPSRRGKLGPVWLVLPALVVVTMLFLWPLIDIGIRSVTRPEFGIGNYLLIFESETSRMVLWRTLGVALISTLICLLVAYPYAYLMTIVSDRAKNLLVLFVMMPLWTSILVRTLAWMVLLQDTGPINDFLEWVGIGRVPLIRTPLGVTIGMVQLLLPFMVLPLYSTMARIDRRLLTASASMGATGIATFLKVYLPLSLRGIYSGVVTVFVLALGFFIVPTLLGSPSEAMLSSLIFQQVSSFLMWGEASALSMTILVLAALIVGLLNLLLVRKFDRRRSAR